ncbi:MAG: DNA methyltransferase [Patescibacteria group bacterium]
MSYFFILGNNPTLSFAEIVAVFKIKPEQVLALTNETLIVDLEEEIDAQQIIRRLGGTIKLGIINDELRIKNYELIANDSIFKLINTDNVTGKFNFGISYYGKGKFKDEKRLAMELKKALKEIGVSSRWVTSREKTLSSVVVEQNKLVGDRGVEIVIINDDAKTYVGKTLAVQPFKELSARDYGRPGRDDYSGMLPPKLAQMMINLSGAEFDDVLLDPFCGSGTILTEAALMGALTPTLSQRAREFKFNLIGADQSEKAVKDTKINVNWLLKQYPISNIQYQLFQCDARQLSQKITRESIDAIVTEPYLGPSRMQRNEKNIRQVAAELENLYRQAMMEFMKVIKPNGRVIMIWPVFKLEGFDISLNSDKILNSSLKIVNPLLGFNSKVLKLTDRKTIVYGRPEQKIWREIVSLKK